MSDNIILKYLFDNARKARWLAFLSEYDFEIKNMKGNENKVANALSRNVNLNVLATIRSYKTNLKDKIEENITFDKTYQNLKDKIVENESEIEKSEYGLNGKGLTMYKNQLHVPNILEIKLLILNEIHQSPYSGHPGYQKMIKMLRNDLFWTNMKNEVAEFLARCMKYQQLKAEHRHPVGLLQPLPIPEWKWEVISIDFITGLPRNKRQNDSIMVVVDKLSKEAHFIHVKSTYKVVNIADIFMK